MLDRHIGKGSGTIRQAGAKGIMRTIKRSAAAVLAAGALFTLGACGGGGQGTSTSTGTTGSAAASPASTSTVEVAATSSAAAVDPAFAALAAEWAPKMAAAGALPTCSDMQTCIEQKIELTKVQTDFLNAATSSGVRLAGYPAVKASSDQLTQTLTGIDAATCLLAAEGSAQAFTCATQVLTAKLNAQTLGNYLGAAAA